MTVRTIIEEPDPRLHLTSKPVLPGEDVGELLVDLRETMLEAGGVGLAAIQVGVALRVLVAQTQTLGLLELTNPWIVRYETPRRILRYAREGCLSVPGKFASVPRSSAILVTYRDHAGHDGCLVRLQGLDAVIVQHELDHLDGILFTDRLRDYEREEQDG